MGARDTVLDHYLAQFAGRETQLAGANLPWLRRARAVARERFAELGLPTTRHEDWKYTSVAAIAKRAFTTLSEGPDGIAAGEVERLALGDSHLLVFVNGRHIPAWSRLDGLPAGAAVCSLAQALVAWPARLEALFADDAEPEANGFTALNAAFWADGVYIDLAAGVVVDRPIHLLFIAARAELAMFPRHLIHLAAGARATIIEHYTGADEAAYLTDAVTRIVTGAGAVLTHAKLQQEGGRAFHIADVRARQAQDSRFSSQSFALGALLSRNEISARLEGEGCTADLLGLYLGQGRQHLDHHTRIDHLMPRGTSRELYHGVLDGASRAVFNGKVIVHADAQQTDADQSNRNLLLSGEAEVDTKPQLEIYADDVKCTHGATVGQLDDQQIYYLRSRGIDEPAARALLIHAFAGQVLRRIEVAALRSRLETLLSGRLPEAAKELRCEEVQPTK